MEIVCKSLDDNIIASERILKQYPDARIFALFGNMGAGKTTLIKSLSEVLGADKSAKSPTFAIVNEYSIISQNSKDKSQKEIVHKNQNSDKIYHFDFYRIKSEEEAYDIGYEEYFYSGNYCFIEWPEKVENLLPSEYVKINIEVKNNDLRLINCSFVH